MGKRFLIIDGKEVEINDENMAKLREIAPEQGGGISKTLLEKLASNKQTELIQYGQVFKYKVGEEVRVGKVNKADRQGNITLARAVNKTRAGWQFSSMEMDTVPKAALLGKIE